jgi:hypothetical protein
MRTIAASNCRPPPHLEREMEGLGVIASTTERARQVFQRSAETTGYFEMALG